MSTTDEVLKGTSEEQTPPAAVEAKRAGARKFEVKPRQSEFRMSDLTLDDVREALTDWMKKHPERLK